MNALQLNADWTQRCVVDSMLLPWQPSPSPKVHRRMLERNGGEVARATSVVRYAPGARFDAHQHDLGEEIVVLSGTFSDASGDYGPGSYLRNPPGTGHAPYSADGCTLFVKLRYMHPGDNLQCAIDTRLAQWQPGVAAGLTVLPLASVGTTHTAIVRWAPDTRFQAHRHYGGEEIFVLDGVFCDEFGDYPAGHWIRNPHLSQHQPFSREGCLILVKTGHLNGV